VADYWDELMGQMWDLVYDVNVDTAQVDGVVESLVARNITDTIEQLAAIQKRLAHRRTAALRVMIAQGMSYGQAAAAVGLSRQRVEQLVNG
jgi:hypothetical protein